MQKIIVAVSYILGMICLIGGVSWFIIAIGWNLRASYSKKGNRLKFMYPLFAILLGLFFIFYPALVKLVIDLYALIF